MIIRLKYGKQSVWGSDGMNDFSNALRVKAIMPQNFGGLWKCGREDPEEPIHYKALLNIIKRNSKTYTFLNSFLFSKTYLFYTIIGRKSRIISIFFVDSDGIPKTDYEKRKVYIIGQNRLIHKLYIMKSFRL